MEHPPKVGEIVTLNSGGPDMTVESIDPMDGSVCCQWFNGNKLEMGIFPTASLAQREENDEGEPGPR